MASEPKARPTAAQVALEQWTAIPDLEALAAAQGVTPLESPSDLRAGFWPVEETTGEFLAALRQWRQEGREEK